MTKNVNKILTMWCRSTITAPPPPHPNVSKSIIIRACQKEEHSPALRGDWFELKCLDGSRPSFTRPFRSIRSQVLNFLAELCWWLGFPSLRTFAFSSGYVWLHVALILSSDSLAGLNGEQDHRVSPIELSMVSPPFFPDPYSYVSGDLTIISHCGRDFNSGSFLVC